MVRDPSDLPDRREEERQPPATEEMARRAAPAGPFTLASLLDLNDDDLTLPLSPAAPPAHRWEQLTLGVTPETGEAVPSSLRTGDSLHSDDDARDLLPGLEAPGAIEIPVYLAGRALHDYLAASPPDTDIFEPVALVTSGDVITGTTDAPTRLAVSPASTTEIFDRRVSPHTDVALRSLRLQCSDCNALSGGELCPSCGGTSAVRRKRRSLRDIVVAGITSPHRPVRTVTALVLVPGELTAAYRAGQTYRFVGPTLVSVAALIFFAAISLLGSVRPRPDRALLLGPNRTAEVAVGLVNDTVLRMPPFLRDVTRAVEFVPVLFLPLMGVLVFGVTVGMRVSARHDADAAMPFTAHVLSWFVLWWGLGVPALLLLLRAGFESAAMLAGVEQARYIDQGGLAGVPASWNAARTIVSTGAFHSMLLAVGLLPWVVLAWRRVFDASWPQAIIAGVLTTAIPLLLLVPFA